MAATIRWSGSAGDGNFNNTANWSGGVVPVTGDSIIVPATATSGMTTNLTHITDATNVGMNIVLFEIQKGFEYDIGSLTTPLRLTADKFVDNGNGNVYFCTDTGTAGVGRDTDRVIIDKDDISKIVYLIGDISGNDSDFTLVEIVRGANVYIGDATYAIVVTTLWVAPRFSPFDVKLTINAAADIITGYMADGDVQFGTSGAAGLNFITTWNMGSGSFDYHGGYVTTLNQYGGVVQHNTETPEGGVGDYRILTYNAVNGFMDSRGSEGTKTILTLNRTPQWSMAYNPKLVVSTTNYIGG
mgnify:CR=1 FL=1